MAKDKLESWLGSYVKKKSIFKNRDVLTDLYVPEVITFRDNHIKEISKIISMALKGSRPNNLFCYGKAGTGKTICIKYIIEKVNNIIAKQGLKVKIIYINCKMTGVADTEYRLILEIAKKLGTTLPKRGLSIKEVYDELFKTLDMSHMVILIFDEIDVIVQHTGDNVLYTFSRINQELKKGRVSIIGITNYLNFVDNLDTRIRATLAEEQIIFPPYNAIHLAGILKQRLKLAFNPKTINGGVVTLCAALSAQEDGSARKALDLLRVAGEIAEREGHKKVKVEDVYSAENKLDLDRVFETVKTQPKQSKCLILAILNLFEDPTRKTMEIKTGDVFSAYQEITTANSVKPLAQSSISNLLSELDLLGIINAKIKTLGRYGRTRTITNAMSASTTKKIKNYLIKELG